MRLYLVPQARADMRAISLYIAEDNPIRAISYVEEIEAMCDSLLTLPERYAVYRPSKDPALRRMVYRSYAIFYRIDGDVVEVIRVLHGARNHDRLLFPRD